eukprot:1790535-Prymnesium_polylepis.1
MRRCAHPNVACEQHEHLAARVGELAVGVTLRRARAQQPDVVQPPLHAPRQPEDRPPEGVRLREEEGERE